KPREIKSDAKWTKPLDAPLDKPKVGSAAYWRERKRIQRERQKEQSAEPSVAEAAPVEKLPEPPEPPPQPPQSEQPPQPPAQPQTLDDASLALKRHIDALRRSEQLQQQHLQQQMAMANNAEGRRRAWLDSTPGARERIDELGVLHRVAIEAGLLDTSPEYFSFLEQQLAALP